MDFACAGAVRCCLTRRGRAAPRGWLSEATRGWMVPLPGGSRSGRDDRVKPEGAAANLNHDHGLSGVSFCVDGDAAGDAGEARRRGDGIPYRGWDWRRRSAERVAEQAGRVVSQRRDPARFATVSTSISLREAPDSRRWILRAVVSGAVGPLHGREGFGIQPLPAVRAHEHASKYSLDELGLDDDFASVVRDRSAGRTVKL